MEQNKAKIASLRWEQTTVPAGLMQMAEMKGNSTNPESYPFPVFLAEVKGANAETVILNPSRKVLADMIEISKRLVAEQGIRAITTSCGFNAVFQKELADALDVPVFTSALLQVPFVLQMIGSDRRVGIVTANRNSLTPRHLEACGIDPNGRIAIGGLEDAPQWKKIFDAPDECFDVEAVGAEIRGAALKLQKDYPDLGAIVLECTDLPPYRAAIAEATHLPVFDFNTMTGFMAMSLGALNLY